MDELPKETQVVDVSVEKCAEKEIKPGAESDDKTVCATKLTDDFKEEYSSSLSSLEKETASDDKPEVECMEIDEDENEAKDCEIATSLLPPESVKTELEEEKKVYVGISKSPSISRAGSPEKKVILLNPALANMFKSPPSGGKAINSVTNTPTTAGSTIASNSSSSVNSKTATMNGGGEIGSDGVKKVEPVGSTTKSGELLKASLALAAALKSEPKKKVFCANTNCNMKTDTVFEAATHAKLYFGMLGPENPKICLTCFKKAEQFHQKSKLMVANQETLFDLKVEIQTASSDAVVDLDSPTGEESFTFGDVKETKEKSATSPDGEQYSLCMKTLDVLINKAMNKFDYKQQVDKCSKSVTKDVDELANQFTSLDVQLDKLRNQIESVTQTYNDRIACKPKSVEIGCVEIDGRGNIRVKQNESLDNLEGLGRLGEKALKRAVAEMKSIEITTVPMEPPRVPRIPLPPALLPTPGPMMNRRVGKLIFVKPKEGQEVYAMHKHSLCYWLSAKILKVAPGNSVNRPTIYTVQFPQKVKPRSRSNDDQDTFIKDVTGRQLAFKKPSAVTLPVGTRIIAKFKDLLKTDAEVDGCLYAGIIAEVPRDTNNTRYLVFFDDGYAQYVSPNEVLPVVESSPDVWLDVHKNSQDFIRDYLMQFPNRHMIRAQVGASFTVELNGQWLLARIVEVDCSMLKMQYLRRTDGVEFEWIYRGSTRLGPLYTRLKSLQARPTLTVARRHTYSSRRTNFSFEVNRDGEDVQVDATRVAKKHTGFDGAQGTSRGGVVRTKNGMVISTVLESEGNMIKIQIPRECPVARAFKPHNCNHKCGYPYVEDDYRKVSPLAIPFYLGWARELSGPNRSKVFYHSPCGIRLGSYSEIHTYITRTKIQIPIDFFSMEANIDCLNEFEPLRRIEYLKDISYGKEWTPVTCVNSLDHDLPTFMEYISARIPSKGVNINNDDQFLVCCDCEDDCQDKEKCACWQLTLSGISFRLAAKEGTKLEGYENRRLKNHVLSGIYECNRKCKCQSTCFNRVVQNKVKWPIQMFKTMAKGWGVRALHDMPQGSFICVYTGQMLTDAGANASGIEVGDEYLAELDFIECNEQIKEDYEDDCTDIESEEPGTRSTARQMAMVAKSNGGSATGPKQILVAKKSTVQKAVKSTGGVKRKFDDDTSGYGSDSTINSLQSSASFSAASRNVGLATARKSGSRNGTMGKSDKSSPPSSGVPSPASSSTSDNGRGSSVSVGSGIRHNTRSTSTSSKDFEVDSDDDDDIIQVYSSFSASASAKDKKNAPRLPLREYFGKDESVYIMDAKSMGNFGRYLNHSCEPNVFVQNLFVDTHDPRFPWVAFFTKKDVKAGTELTWDYNYDIGSVPGKTLYCYCFQSNCRERLL